MKLSIIATIFLATAINAAAAQDPFRLPEGGEPKYLMPPSINGNLDYEVLLNEKLLSRYGRGPFGTMLALPAFTPEYCVSIYEQKEDNTDSLESKAGEPREFVASAAKASRNLHGWLQEKQRGDQVSDVEITYKIRRVSRELATAFQRIWSRSILQTRYPSSVPPRICDGIGFRFSVVLEIGEISGDAHNPEKGIGLVMANIGHQLYEYVMDEPTAANESDLIEGLKKLQKNIETEQAD